MDNSKCIRCGNTFTEADNVVYCPTCGAYHHLECWQNSGGCSNPECSTYVGTHTKYTYSNYTQPQSSVQEIAEPPKKKLSVLLILLLSFLGLAITGLPFCFLDGSLETLGTVLLLFGGIGFGVILIIFEFKLMSKAIKHNKQKLEETKKLSKLAAAGDKEAQAQLVKTGKKYDFVLAIAAIVIIVVIVISCTSHTADHFADNLSSDYRQDDISLSELRQYGFNASKYGIKDCISASNKYSNNTVIIVQCRSSLKAMQAAEDCEDIADKIEHSSGKNAVVVRKGNCILVGHERAVKDALK
jgi:hypothetical protein